MLKLLIVEDEKIFRHGIITSFDWTSLGVDKVLEAKNGKQGLEIFMHERPDIILSDIHMPLMNGIELTRQIRMIDNNCQIIYITGFSDIEYLKSAFKNNAVDYILKPVDIEELKSAIKKATSKSQESYLQSQLMNDMQQKLIQSMPLLIKEFMFRVLNSNYPSEQYVNERLNFLKIPFEMHDRFVVSVIIAKKSTPSSLNDDLITIGIENIAQEIIQHAYTGYIFRDLQGYFVTVIKACDLNQAQLKEIFTNIYNLIIKHLDIYSTIAIGNCVDGFLNIQESYESAKMAIKYQTENDEKGVIIYDGDYKINSENYQIDINFAHSLLEVLYCTDKNEIKTEVNRIFSKMTLSLPELEYFRGYCTFVTAQVISNVCSQSINKAYIDFFIQNTNNIKEAHGIKEVISAIVSLFCDLKVFISKDYHPQSIKVIDEIKAIINANICNNLTIKDISQKIFLTPTYICAIFKESTGMTINEYTTDQKITYAQDLMKADSYRFYEICSKLGYQDTKYFSKLFKRKTGITPSEYIGKVRNLLE